MKNKNLEKAADLLSQAINLLEEDRNEYLRTAIPSDPDMATDEGERFGKVTVLRYSLANTREMLREIR